MTGDMITITAGGGAELEAYLAKPAGDGPWPGLVILAEVYNVNHWVREICDGYAEQGYMCLAPDLYWRQEPGAILSTTRPIRSMRAGSASRWTWTPSPATWRTT